MPNALLDEPLAPCMALSSARLVALLVLVLALAACDESIPPPDAIEQTYTLWGAFDPGSDTQYVRVVPIADTISLGDAAPLGVEVRSTDLSTGEETLWRDSVITYRNGAVGHVFMGDVRPRFESRHVFRVIPAESDEVSALVPVPPLVEPLRQTTRLTAAEATYPIFWPGAPQVNNPTLTYFFEDGECNRDSLQVPFPGASDPAEFGWQMALRLDEDSNDDILRRVAFPTAVTRLTVRAEIASEGWRLPLAAANDRELLIQPSVLTNVENGYGFVGSAYRAELSWEPTADELQRTPFEFPNFGEDCTRR